MKTESHKTLAECEVLDLIRQDAMAAAKLIQDVEDLGEWIGVERAEGLAESLGSAYQRTSTLLERLESDRRAGVAPEQDTGMEP